MITYVIPTHNRPAILAETLAAIALLGPHGAEVLIVDNASQPPAAAPAHLASGVPCRIVRLGSNIGAAARNVAITHADASSRWLLMLDDDSAPLDLGFIGALCDASADVAIIAAEIFLPSEQGARLRHESGGLPEVFVGCGAAIRAEFFREQGGYDERFDYYAEEYDLSARAIVSGMRVGFDRRFRVLHRKVTAGRDFGRIVSRLVRNNAWVGLRYAPDEWRASAVAEQVVRYGVIAQREGALGGYARGVMELARSWREQPRRAMPGAMWDRFIGLAAARVAVDEMVRRIRPRSVALVAAGKNAGVVARAVEERGIAITDDTRAADALVVATLSPGPMLDAAAPLGHGAPLVRPWLIEPGAREDSRCASAA